MSHANLRRGCWCLRCLKVEGLKRRFESIDENVIYISDNRRVKLDFYDYIVSVRTLQKTIAHALT